MEALPPLMWLSPICFPPNAPGWILVVWMKFRRTISSMLLQSHDLPTSVVTSLPFINPFPWPRAIVKYPSNVHFSLSVYFSLTLKVYCLNTMNSDMLHIHSKEVCDSLHVVQMYLLIFYCSTSVFAQETQRKNIVSECFDERLSQ